MLQLPAFQTTALVVRAATDYCLAGLVRWAIPVPVKHNRYDYETTKTMWVHNKRSLQVND